MPPLSKTLLYVTKNIASDQWFSTCGPWTGSISIISEMARNTNSEILNQKFEGSSPDTWVLISPPWDSSTITCHGTSFILLQCSYHIGLLCSLIKWNPCLLQCLTLTVHYSWNAVPKSPQSAFVLLVRFQLKCKLYKESLLTFLSTHLITFYWTILLFCL